MSLAMLTGSMDLDQQQQVTHKTRALLVLHSTQDAFMEHSSP